MEPVTALALVAIAAIAPVPISMVMEALRKRPEAPASLPWAPDIAIQYVDVDGSRLRYIRAGDGPPLVLLHTLRTQLDIFHKVFPELAGRYTVYAVDYPGHGWSEIPEADFAPPLFTRAVSGFLDALDIDQAVLAGISIGGTIPLLLAAEEHPRIRGVVSINPYDYARGRGLQRANLVARLVGSAALVPVLGETVMRMRLPIIEKAILSGGVASKDALTPMFLNAIWQSGCRPGHYQGFLNLLRHAAQWDEAHEVYGNIRVPVLLLYGIEDWANDADRRRTAAGIPGATLEVVEGGGHFLTLDQPGEVIRHIDDFFAALPAATAPPAVSAAG